jgi:hypothetical protein
VYGEDDVRGEDNARGLTPPGQGDDGGNIVLRCRIALRAHASLVRSVGVGLCCAGTKKPERAGQSCERIAPPPIAKRNLNLKRVRRGFSRFLYFFSKDATFTGLNCNKSELVAIVSRHITL